MLKETRIYKLHRRSRSKKRSALISKLLLKKASLLRKVKAFYRVGTRLIKPYLLYWLNHHIKQKGLIHEHHYTAVIIM